MRSPIRWSIVFVTIAVALLGLRALALPYVRATSLIVRSAGLEQQHPTIASLQTQTIKESKGSVPSRHGPLRARIYTPTLSIQRAVMLTPGVNALGIDEPRLVAFAKNLASSGLLVVSPEIPDLSAYQITPRCTDQIEDAALWLANNQELSGGKKIGVVGISFAGGLSVVASSRPSLKGRLAFVFSFGGHANFQRVVRYLCTGQEPEPPAGVAMGKLPVPHDYGVAIVTLDLAHKVVPPEQSEPLRQGILKFLHASHLALFDQKKAEAEFVEARAMEAALPEPARTFMHLVNVRDVSVLGQKLLPFIADLGDVPALSPDLSPAPDCPVFLLHGLEDNVVPAVETLRLEQHLAKSTKVRVLLTPLISHAEVDRPASADEVKKMLTFWAEMLKAG
jgi:dienelactone hydrolase